MLQPYDEYKETGVEWLGQIPEGWEVVKISELFQERRTKVSDKDYEPLSVTKNGIVPQLLNAAKSNDGDNRKLVCSGDFVINSRSDRKGSSGIAILTGSVSLINIALEPRQRNNRQFIHYLLKSNSFTEEYYRHGRGIVADLWTTRYSEMKIIILPVPPLPEQEQIVQYLNWQTSKINKLVKAKKKQIELLKEQKQAVINKAVTKGLNNTVPMKESGVEWLGQIPQGWEVRRIKNLSIVKRGASPRPIDNPVFFSVSGKYSWVRIADITKSNKYLLKTTQKLSELGSSLSVKIAPNNLFISIAGSVGKPIIAKIYCCIHDGFVYFPFISDKVINNEFLYYIFTNAIIYQSLGKLGTQLNLNTESIGRIETPVPPLPEQKAIVAYLEEKTARIDKAIAVIEKEIALILEYKTSLISAVVTGKVDVRNVQVPYYDVEEDTIEDIKEVEDIEETEAMEEE